MDSQALEHFADWSASGRHLIYSVISDETGFDIGLMSRDADGRLTTPRPFLATPFSEASPQISPDGRYVVYRSDESGQDEVMYASFPKAKGAAKFPRPEARSRAGGSTAGSCSTSTAKF